MRTLILPFSAARIIESLRTPAYGACGLAEGYFGNGERAVVDFLDFGSYLHRAASLSVVVLGDIEESARHEVGIERKRLFSQIGDCRVDYLVEVVGQDFRRQTHSDSLDSLHEQQRELCRQCHGLGLASVVGHCPVGSLGIVQHLKSERRESRLDVTPCRSRSSGEHVTPVSLSFHEQLLLSELNERIVNRLVAVRVILHGVAHDVGHLVEASVVECLHRVQDASLYGLQTVGYVGYGTFKYNVGSIVEKPALVHSTQLMAHDVVGCVDRDALLAVG